MPQLTPLTLSGYVVKAAFLGETPAFALGDGSVTLGTGDHVVRPHAGGLLVAEVSADGKALLSGGDDGKVMRTTADGETTVVAERPRKWIDLLAVGPGGALAFASGRTAWAIDGAGNDYTLERPRAVGGLAFFPRGFRVAVAGYNGVALWYPGTAPIPQELEWKGAHTLVTVSPDGANVVTAMQEMALHGWRLKDGQHMRMSGYPAKIKSLSWSAKGRYLASSGAGVSVVWPFHYKDGPMGRAPLELGGRQETVVAVACHPSEEVVAIGYEDGMILLCRFSDGEEVLLRRPDGAPITSMGWSPDGLTLAFGADSGAAGCIDLTK